MTTIIDSLLVTLGLDDEQFTKHRAGVDDGLKKTRTEGGKTSEALNDLTNKASLGFSKLRGEVIGMFLAFAGAKTVGSFLTNMITQVREVGTAAQNMGLDPNTLNAWGNAAKDAGGEAQDAIAAFTTINDLFADFTRHPEIIGQKGKLLGQLGLTGEKDFADPEETMKLLADQFQRELTVAKASGDPLAEERTRATFKQRLAELGITSSSMVRIIEQGRAAIEREIDANKKRNSITEADVKAAQDATAAINHLSMALYGLAQHMGVIQGLDGVAQALDFVTGSSDKLGGAGRQLAAGFLAMFDPIESLVLLLKKFHIISDDTASTVLHHDPIASWIGGWLGGGPAEDSHGGIGGPSGGETAVQMTGHANRAANGGHGRDAGTALKYFITAGLSPAAAAGMAAAVVAEGGLTQRTGGGYQGRAIGVGQLLGDRRTAFLKKYGSNFTFENELEFMVHELKGGKQGGSGVLNARSAEEALRAAVFGFYRPQGARNEHYAAALGDVSRGRDFLARYKQALHAHQHNTVHVTVHAPGHAKPHDVAHKTGKAVQKAMGGFGLVANANSGVSS